MNLRDVIAAVLNSPTQQRRRFVILLAAYLSTIFYNKLLDAYWRTPSVPHANQLIATRVLHERNEKVYCLGFRRTSCGSTTRLPWLDLNCDALIPSSAAGYCEYVFEKGTSLSILRKKSCQTFKLAKAASCRMAVDFYNYKHDAKAFVAPSKPTSATAAGRGIVMAIYPQVVLSVYSIIHVLRDHHQCQLPIELWYIPSEMDMENNNPLLQEILDKFDGISLRTTPTTDSNAVSGFMIKPYSIFYSHFQQVLWLDADNVPLKDPTYLFGASLYQETGTLFFKDYWQPVDSIFLLNEHSLVWELLGIPYRNEFEVESGQLLMDKRRPNTMQALETIIFMATHYETRWLGPLALLWGDKDLFRMGFYMTNNSLSFVERPPSPLGYTVPPTNQRTYQQLRARTNGMMTTCGITMVQYDPEGQPLFLHRNSYKLTMSNNKNGATLKNNHEKVWESIYEYYGQNPSTEYRIGSTKDKTRKVTCYHPTIASAPFFQERNASLVYPEIITVEEQFLKYAQQGMALMGSVNI